MSNCHFREGEGVHEPNRHLQDLMTRGLNATRKQVNHQAWRHRYHGLVVQPVNPPDPPVSAAQHTTAGQVTACQGQPARQHTAVLLYNTASATPATQRWCCSTFSSTAHATAQFTPTQACFKVGSARQSGTGTGHNPVWGPPPCLWTSQPAPSAVPDMAATTAACCELIVQLASAVQDAAIDKACTPNLHKAASG